MLQNLYDELWMIDDRVSIRAKSIALRERYPENSPEHREHHSEVSRLHREVWLLLRERGSQLLDDEDRPAFNRIMNVK